MLGAKNVCDGHRMTVPKAFLHVQRGKEVWAPAVGGSAPPRCKTGSYLSPCPSWADKEMTHLGTLLCLRVHPDTLSSADVAHRLQDARPTTGDHHHDTAKSEGGALDDAAGIAGVNWDTWPRSREADDSGGDRMSGEGLAVPFSPKWAIVV